MKTGTPELSRSIRSKGEEGSCENIRSDRELDSLRIAKRTKIGTEQDDRRPSEELVVQRPRRRIAFVEIQDGDGVTKLIDFTAQFDITADHKCGVSTLTNDDATGKYADHNTPATIRSGY